MEEHEFFASICVPSKMTQRLNRHLHSASGPREQSGSMMNRRAEKEEKNEKGGGGTSDDF